MIKALFFDIDGTLVSFKTHEIPVSTIEALTAAKAKGIHIFISTGRPRVIINNLSALQERNLIDGYITMNGAYCFVEDTVIYKSPIPTAEVDALTAFCHERNIPCILVGEHDICVNQPGEVVEEIFHRQLKVDPLYQRRGRSNHPARRPPLRDGPLASRLRRRDSQRKHQAERYRPDYPPLRHQAGRNHGLRRRRK